MRVKEDRNSKRCFKKPIRSKIQKNEPEEPHVENTPQYKDGKIAAQKCEYHKPETRRRSIEYELVLKTL